MDQALQVFLNTLAVVGGILSPIIVIIILLVIAGILSTSLGKIAIKLKEYERQQPFDDVAANLNPMTHVLTIRIFRNGKKLWEGSATQNQSDRLNTDFSEDAE